MREIPVECGGPDSPGGPAGPRTAGDAALAARLQAEEDAVAKAAAPRGRRRPRSPPSEPPDELPPLVDSPAASPSPRAERPPSAPPLTREAMGADWAEEWWAQQPGAGADDSPLAQPLDEDDQQGVGGDAWRRQQLAADEALARQLYAEEVQQLSERDRARLSSLPARLRDSELVRTLSDRLSDLAGSFTKLLPTTNPAPEERQPVDAGRQRLDERLKLYCLVERKVAGDGSCQFRALSDQLFRTPRLHRFVRECVVRQLRERPEWYRDYVMDDWDTYAASMAQDGTWGDHVTLQAAADWFGCRIGVLSSFERDFLLEIAPRQQKSPRMLWLSFWAEVHYNSLHPETEPPEPLSGSSSGDEEDDEGAGGPALGGRGLGGLLRSLRGDGGGGGGGGGSGRGGVRVIPVE